MEKTEGSESATATGCPSETELAGKADMCKGCPGQALCRQQGGRDPDQELLDTRMRAVKHKILILSGKGGVGKSSVAACLSMALAELSQKVMSVGSLLEQSDNAVIWRGPRKTALIRRFLKDTFWGRLDVLICDTPPGTSDEHLTVVKAMKGADPDGAVIVTTPQEVAIATIRKELNFCRKLGVRVIGVVENLSGFVCPCCQERTDIFSTGAGERLAEEYRVPFLGRIPIDQLTPVPSSCPYLPSITADPANLLTPAWD
ncbi:hypothetical protein Bbelb_108690 [Branchiostoma belcheri]|nr:hypothetical protein Bbelb_108690 [Branchiostoma belcheri]